MLGIKGTGDSKKAPSKEEQLKIKQKKRIRRLAFFGFMAVVIAVWFIFGYMKSLYAEYSKNELQEFVEVWKPIQNTNEATIESDIQKLNTETAEIKEEMEKRSAPINAQGLKADIINFFDYASVFTSDMHKDFQWSKDLNTISIENDQVIANINFNDGSGPLLTTLEESVSTMRAHVREMDAMQVSTRVMDAHKQFRDSVSEEADIYDRLLTAVRSNNTEATKNLSTEIMVFNEKFGKMSGPSSALTIAYLIKTKEFEIKIEKLGKEIDRASNIVTNNIY